MPADNRSNQVWNIPNQITAARLVLSVACFAFLSFGWFGTALVLFLIAAGTDWLDGYWARRFNQITQLGRILDPFADKIIICGSFIFLAATPGSRIAAWVAVVVMGREMLVTALRSFVEERGGDFSAKWVGKWKMVFQCAAVGFSLLLLWQTAQAESIASWLPWAVDISVWTTIVLTLYSGWGYISSAIGLATQLSDQLAHDTSKSN